MKSTKQKGRIGELLVKRELKKRNFKFNDRAKKVGHTYDFDVNDRRVEVKTSIRKNNDSWTFGVRFENLFDYLICVGIRKKNISFYIVPTYKIKGRSGITFVDNINISPCYKKYKKFKDKWNWLK